MKTTTIITAIALTTAANAQDCLVNNPSFEVGNGLQGWTTLNDTAFDTDLIAHGRRSISLGIPNNPNQTTSSIAQVQDAGPGDTLTVTLRAGHKSSNPLTGDAHLTVAVDWLTVNGSVLSTESFQVLTPADPTDRLHKRSVTTGNFPRGAWNARVTIAATRTNPTDTGRAIVDMVEVTRPDFDTLQWDDFPGGTTLDFAGYAWRVKGPGFYGPGPNTFSNSPNNVSVDQDGLDIRITGSPGNWASSEIATEEVLGYGDYIFTTKGRADAIADNVVLGFFLWQYPNCFDEANLWNQHNEIDVEISRWGNPFNSNAQFVTQPFYEPENITRFDIQYNNDNELVSYAFNWLPGRIEYRAWRGGPNDESPLTTLNTWTYADDHLPTPEIPRVHINLWYFGEGPANNQPQQVTVADFNFNPLGDTNLDNQQNFFDLLTHLHAADAQAPEADLDNDGTADTNDTLLFLTEGLGIND